MDLNNNVDRVPPTEAKQYYELNTEPKFAHDQMQHIEINLSRSNTISASVDGSAVQCLIDTGASVNLINHDWLHNNIPSIASSIQKPRLDMARAANGSDLDITGFIVLPIFAMVHNFISP